MMGYDDVSISDRNLVWTHTNLLEGEICVQRVFWVNVNLWEL